MRVAIVQESLDTARGGAETSTREMAEALAALGVDVTVICTATDDDNSRDPMTGVRVVSLAARGLTRAGRVARYLRRAAEFVARERFDIVHGVVPVHGAHVYQPRGGTYLETIQRSVARGKTPLARGVRRLGRVFNFKQRLLLGAERDLLTCAQPPVVAAVSGYVRRQVVSGYPRFPAKRVRVVFNGVAFQPLGEDRALLARRELRREWSVTDERPVLLFVAHNFGLKGLSEAIAALGIEALRKRSAMFIVAGRDDSEPFRRRAESMGVGESVRFIGVRTPVTKLFAAADVLVHPTHYDPCSRVVLEALVAGLPVVTTVHNGAAEVVEHGKQGFVVENPGDIDALADAIVAALSPNVGRAAKETLASAAERLSMRRHASELLALYEEILRERR